MLNSVQKKILLLIGALVQEEHRICTSQMRKTRGEPRQLS